MIDFKLKSPTKTPVYLLIDICVSNYVCGSLLPVLRQLDTKSACFSYPTFIKVNKQQIQSIRAFIKRGVMQEVEAQDFFCTLCLKQTGNVIL